MNYFILVTENSLNLLEMRTPGDGPWFGLKKDMTEFGNNKEKLIRDIAVNMQDLYCY